MSARRGAMIAGRAFATPFGALARIPAGSRVFIAPTCGEPLSLTEALGSSWRELPPMHLLFSIQSSDHAFLNGVGERFTAESWGVQPGAQDAVASGAVKFVPIRYSRVPQLLGPGGRLSVDVALVQVSPPDARGYCSLGASVGLPRDIVPQARLVIAEVNPHVPRTRGDSLVHLDELDVLVEGTQPIVPFPIPAPAELDHAIGRHVAALVPDGATIQIGIGAIPDAVLWALSEKNDLGVHSGMVSGALSQLIDRGVVTNARKPIDGGVSVTGELMGTADLFRWADENPALCMRAASYTHDPGVLSRITNLVAINSAIEIDLTGQVNAESVGTRQVSAVGGQFDFADAVMARDDGISVLALRSTAGRAKVSKIVAELAPGSGVTLPRYLIDRVVTEHGVAELRNRSFHERADALIRIAHPDHRDELRDRFSQRFGKGNR